jgi:hypothetical protein
MGKIQNALKGASQGSLIKLSDAMAIGQKADNLLDRSVEKLTLLKKNVGETDGEDIAHLIAEINGQKLNAAMYSYNREPDGQ